MWLMGLSCWGVFKWVLEIVEGNGCVQGVGFMSGCELFGWMLHGVGLVCEGWPVEGSLVAILSVVQ